MQKEIIKNQTVGEKEVIENTPTFSQETVDTLYELGAVLDQIYNRMKREGYDIIGDRIIHLATGKVYDSKDHKTQYYAKRD